MPCHFHLQNVARLLPVCISNAGFFGSPGYRSNLLLCRPLTFTLPNPAPSSLAARLIRLKLEHESLLPKLLPRLRVKPSPECGWACADPRSPPYPHLHSDLATSLGHWKSPSAFPLPGCGTGSASSRRWVLFPPHSFPLALTSPLQRGLPSLSLHRSHFPPYSPSSAVPFRTLTAHSHKSDNCILFIPAPPARLQIPREQGPWPFIHQWDCSASSTSAQKYLLIKSRVWA